MVTELITYRGTVYPWHCDHVGHMNVMWYVGKFDEATWHYFHEVGLTPSWLRENRRGMAAVDQHIAYLAELHAGDIVTVTTASLEVKAKSLKFVHEMRNDETGGIAARTILTAVHLDAVARKACALPDPVIARANALIAPASSGSSP
jgi:acyl-CoA thioester hydrolase